MIDRTLDHAFRVSRQLVCILVWFLVGWSEGNVQSQIQSDIAPHQPGSWDTIPSWAEDLPFDLQSQMNIPDVENRESNYLEALLEIDSSVAPYFPHLRDLDQESLDALRSETRKRVRPATDFLFDHLIDDHDGLILPDRKLKEKMGLLLTPLAQHFEKLEEALRRPNCFFRSDFSFDTLGSHTQAVRASSYFLAMKCNLDLSSPDAVSCLETGLRLKRDMVPMGGLVSQIVNNVVEDNSLDWMAVPILGQASLTQGQLDRLIVVMKTHVRDSRKTDPYLESAKVEMLSFMNLFHLLENGKYVTAGRLDDNSIEDGASAVQLLFRQILDYGFYETNEAQIRSDSAPRAKASDAISVAWKEIQDDPDTDWKVFSRMMLGLIAHQSLSELQPGDFEEDIKILRQRFTEIEAAVALPFPKSSEQLERLGKNWVLDDGWKRTRLLRWIRPHDPMVKIRTYSALNNNAFLCLAAIRNSQLKHGVFTDLSRSVKEIGLDAVPIDPYSGKGLKAIVKDNLILVYSVGPDGDDDGAESEYDRQRRDGDIVFRVEIK